MDQRQDDGLRNEDRPVQRHNHIRIGVHEKITKLRCVLGMQYAKVYLVPLFGFNGRSDRCSFLWLRIGLWECRGVRCLRCSDTIGVPGCVQRGRRLRLRREIVMPIIGRRLRSGGRHILSGGTHVLLGHIGRAMLDTWSWRIVILLNLRKMMHRSWTRARGIHGKEFDLFRESSDGVL